MLRKFLLVLFIALLVPFGSAQDKENNNGIDWQDGPVKGKLGEVAEINVPAGYRFTGKEGAKRVMEITQNPLTGNELGVLIPAEKPKSGNTWFVVFEFDDIGYVKDDEQNALDASALLQSIQEGTEKANETRKQKGWPGFHVTGWAKPPYYDLRTHNLTWAILGRGDDPKEGDTVNYSTRILGRRGSMNVDLVLDKESVATVVPEFESLISGVSYVQGQRYSEFTRGDRVAEVGLAALIAGGAGAVAVKTGLLAKFWKVFVALFVAIAGLIKKFFRAIGKALGLVKDPPPEEQSFSFDQNTPKDDNDQTMGTAGGQ